MSIVKLQIPIDKAVRDELAKRAEELGFDSIQAYIRFWAKAEVSGRKIDLGDDWGQPTPAAVMRLNKNAEEAIRDSKAGKLESFTTAEAVLKHLNSL